MRILNDTEMRAAAGGVEPLTGPPVSIPESDDEWVNTLIQMQLQEPQIGGN